ncbi:MAG: hypothetical protein ONB16_05700 [candidate division KSB1 bacterium]|nr:hypothetical protein [candidate division KSB1 bacterium]MDZ7341348.1 hypothetical protein [candidate division KSB1 bacterium]
MIEAAIKHRGWHVIILSLLENRTKFLSFLAVVFIILLVPTSLLAQLSRLDERELPFLTAADTMALSDKLSETRPRVQSALRSPPRVDYSRQIPSYFRDGYRLVQDMRRLVQMVDYGAIHGYESVSELMQLARQLPLHKQTAMIGMALTGGAVNFIADATNRHLRKRKVSFVEWKVERIILRKHARYFNTNIQSGLTTRSLGVYVPALRTQFYRDLTPYYKSEGFIFYSRRHAGFDLSRENGNLIWTPFYFSSIGTIQLSYNSTRRIIRSKVDFRRSSAFVVRLVMIDQLKQVHGKFILGEAIFSW